MVPKVDYNQQVSLVLFQSHCDGYQFPVHLQFIHNVWCSFFNSFKTISLCLKVIPNIPNFLQPKLIIFFLLSEWDDIFILNHVDQFYSTMLAGHFVPCGWTLLYC